jgi:hypothetical protein
MSQVNCLRPGCRDVFHAFLVENADYEGFFEIPKLDYLCEKPLRVIAFSKIIKSKDFDCWVHFFEDDVAFERIWNNPRKYLPILKRFKGVISPDFSLYRDMPLVMQYWNIYRSRAIARWLQDNGVKVIVNVRWGDRRTHSISCCGVPKNGAIAIGSHGTLKQRDDREYFVNGLKYVVDNIHPKIIVVYGAAPDSIFAEYKEQGILILQFDSSFAISRRKEDA